MDFLLIDDDPGDVRLTQEGFPIQTAAATLHIVRDGEAAMSFREVPPLKPSQRMYLATSQNT